jgi:hypothetical protein
MGQRVTLSMRIAVTGKGPGPASNAAELQEFVRSSEEVITE